MYGNELRLSLGQGVPSNLCREPYIPAEGKILTSLFMTLCWAKIEPITYPMLRVTPQSQVTIGPIQYSSLFFNQMAVTASLLP